MKHEIQSGACATVDIVALEQELRSNLGEAETAQVLQSVPAPTCVTTADFTYWIHAKWQYTSYYFYTEYYFECSTRLGSDPNSEIFPVEQIILRWRHGQTRGQEVKDNAGFIGKSDRLYNLSPDTDCCVHGLSRHLGMSGDTAAPPGCSHA